jgi:4-amino-4-deoxy-L-arabinose transferase-like glycosyltransferase
MITLASGVAIFLASRLVFLDADVPTIKLTQYSPIDEFAYSVPAFNLLHYGTWTHQVAAWAPVEGWPMNVLQNVVAAFTMQVVGYTYWGLRASSILFGLVAFLAMVGVIERATRETPERAEDSRRWPLAILTASVILLLVDFSSLISGRVVEPTISRVAVVAGLVWLISRGTFLGNRPEFRRNLVLGLLVGGAVWFVYIYNVFLIPGVLVAVLAWAWKQGRPAVARHATAFVAGVAIATAAYFVAIWAVYHLSPVGWYQTWIASYGNSARFEGPTIAHLTSLLDANIFRLDRPFLLLFLLGLPIFAWWTVKVRRPWAVLVWSLLIFFVAQSAFIADYPQRKFLILVVMALPSTAVAILWRGPFIDWLLRTRVAWLPAVVWVLGVVGLVVRRISSFSLTPTFDLMLRASAWIGVVALLLWLISRSRPLTVISAAVAFATMVTPLAYLDATYVYRHPTYSYRDTLIAVRREIDGHITAGSLAFGMQLYNQSLPVLNGYFYGISRQQYNDDVVRLFAEGGADTMFEYDRPGQRATWEARGFKLVEVYDIKLPNGWRMGRYVWSGTTP